MAGGERRGGRTQQITSLSLSHFLTFSHLSQDGAWRQALHTRVISPANGRMWQLNCLVVGVRTSRTRETTRRG